MTEVLSRRNLLKVAGAAGAAAVAQPGISEPQHHHGVPSAPFAEQGNPAAPTKSDSSNVLFFFHDAEAKFVGAAVERLIPAEPEWPGAEAAGVLNFIDRQLAGAFGAGARMYLKGPWVPDAPPQQGYQLRFTPSELYRIGIEETRRYTRVTFGGREFWEIGAAAMDDVLGKLESGAIDLPSLPAPVFFETLLANTIEGYFADPAYGGNRDMVSWRMVGFPGAYAQYPDLVDAYNFHYMRPPISMANRDARHNHIRGHR
jgi:gluconate 2-dehydrogenase gamma chain